MHRSGIISLAEIIFQNIPEGSKVVRLFHIESVSLCSVYAQTTVLTPCQRLAKVDYGRDIAAFQCRMRGIEEGIKVFFAWIAMVKTRHGLVDYLLEALLFSVISEQSECFYHLFSR